MNDDKIEQTELRIVGDLSFVITKQNGKVEQQDKKLDEFIDDDDDKVNWGLANSIVDDVVNSILNIKPEQVKDFLDKLNYSLKSRLQNEKENGQTTTKEEIKDDSKTSREFY